MYDSKALYMEFVDGFLDKWFCSFILEAYPYGLRIRTLTKSFEIPLEEIKIFQSDLLPQWACWRLRRSGDNSMKALRIVHLNKKLPQYVIFFSKDNERWFSILEELKILTQDNYNFRYIRAGWRKWFAMAVIIFCLSIIGVLLFGVFLTFWSV